MTSSLTPAQFDAKELEAYKELWAAESRLPGVMNLAHRHAGDQQVSNGYGRPKSWRMTDREARGRLDYLASSYNYPQDPSSRLTPCDVIAEIEQAEYEIGQRRQVIAEMEAVYAQAPWTRWFKCTNPDGHVHSSLRDCPTVRFDTPMAWITDMSGQDEDAAVADPRLGPTLCSVCFPEAPVERRLTQREVDREAREADKLARQEAKYAKQLRDDEVFRTSDRDRVTTVAACKALVRRPAETAVELEWCASEDGKARFSDEESRQRFIRNVTARLEGEKADAAEANRVLLAREESAPGTGWTQADADKAVASAVKRTRKAYFG